MASNKPINIAQQMAQIARDVGETMVEEVKEVGRTAVSQTTGLEKSPPGGQSGGQGQKQTSQQGSSSLGAQIEAENRAKKSQQELAFYRRQLAQMKQELQQIRQEKIEQQQLKDQEDQVKQAEIQRAQISAGPTMPPGGATKRGTALIGGKGKNKKTGFEVGGAGAKHSK